MNLSPIPFPVGTSFSMIYVYVEYVTIVTVIMLNINPLFAFLFFYWSVRFQRTIITFFFNLRNSKAVNNQQLSKKAIAYLPLGTSTAIQLKWIAALFYEQLKLLSIYQILCPMNLLKENQTQNKKASMFS